jgi:PPOX class probable F420-dependent enzyme
MGEEARMASKRSAISMTDDEVRAYLEEQRVLNVATIGPSGHPHLVAMWFAVVDGQVAFWTFGKSQKVLNLRRDPKITCLVESGDTYSQLRGVELVGTARIVDDYDLVLRIGTAVGAKYSVGAASDASMALAAGQARKRLGIVVDVERVVSWDHTKLGGAY